mmetsp:Transcript_1213/g.2107  ORF Transcript_1213/g.2107 Transcript_1213/m.2107 type:complete len:94 (+) Transcript_1213:1026-1307(+)
MLYELASTASRSFAARGRSKSDPAGAAARAERDEKPLLLMDGGSMENDSTSETSSVVVVAASRATQIDVVPLMGLAGLGQVRSRRRQLQLCGA